MKCHYVYRLICGDWNVFHGVIKSAKVSNTNQYRMTIGSLEVLCNETLRFGVNAFFFRVGFSKSLQESGLS